MSNEELLEQAYTETHRASDIASRVWNAAARSDVVTIAEAKEDLIEMRQRLTKALCAAQELENRAHGNKPPKEGE